MRVRTLMMFMSLLVAMLVAAPVAFGATTKKDRASAAKQSGGAAYGVPVDDVGAAPITPGSKGKIVDGVASAPADAPQAVKDAIAAGNKIVGKPYVYGGGHARFRSTGYDCSGTISYALHGGGLVDSPLDSSSFMGWGEAGPGAWITVYTNPGHAFVVIAGMRLDTSAAGDPSGAKGPRWRPTLRSTSGFKARHPEGL